jgi:hypothetical protein
MALSKKQRREINRLKDQANDLWDDQKDVLERANKVIREASRHAGSYTREELAPRAREAFDGRVRPAVASGFSSASSAASSAATATKEKLVEDVFPAVSSAFGSALAMLEVTKDPQFREALKRVTSAGGVVSDRAATAYGKAGSALNKAVGKKVVPAPKSSSGPGRYILIGIGVVALIGVAYAAWQTLRADDDLWIDDEELSEPSGDIQPS